MIRGFDDKGSSSRNGLIDPSFPTPMGTVALSSEQGTLGEMDPVDDTIMQRKQLKGGECLLGYNLNRGLRSTRSSERTILLSHSIFICFVSSHNINECPYSLIHCFCFCLLCDVPTTLCRRHSAFASL
jgi:hypothetical protein